MTRLTLSDNFTKHRTKILCLYKTLHSFVATQEYLTCNTSLPGCNFEIMYVFLSILNINSIINLDAVAKNRCGWWTGNKIFVNVGLISAPKLIH